MPKLKDKSAAGDGSADHTEVNAGGDAPNKEEKDGSKSFAAASPANNGPDGAAAKDHAGPGKASSADMVVNRSANDSKNDEVCGGEKDTEKGEPNVPDVPESNEDGQDDAKAVSPQNPNAGASRSKDGEGGAKTDDGGKNESDQQRHPDRLTSSGSRSNSLGRPSRGAEPAANARVSSVNPNARADADFDDNYSDSRDTLLTMAFNQDGGCLAVGTGSGFRICNVNPFQETFRRSLGGGDAEGGGIAHIEMLFRTNLLAITGHSSSPHYPPNKVIIYDDHLQRTIGELVFRQKVLATKLRRDRIVVVLRDRVYIYNFSDLALLDKVHTGDNPLGLIGISMDNGGVGGSTTGVARAVDVLGSGSGMQRNNGMVLACPSAHRGEVRVELYGLRRTTVVNAHESVLGALALSVDGSLLATASERGTVIRLFDTRGVTIGGGSGGGTKQGTTSISSSTPLREFRRGVERATVSCLAFSLDSAWLACASNHGTVHVFQTQDSAEASAKKSRSASMTGMAIRMLPKLVSAPKKYLVDGVQSCAQVRGVPRPRACAFVPDRERTVAVAGMDEYGNGCLLLAEFGRLPGGEDGGAAEGGANDPEARRLGYHRFFKRKAPASHDGRRRTRGGDAKHADNAAEEGGAYIDDAPVDVRMNHISIGDENEDHFVPIEYTEEK